MAGGAEVVNEELARRLVKDGHEVIFVVAGFSKSARTDLRHGFKIIRLGNRWTVYWRAYRYYKQHLQGKVDLVIDEVNTMPFFAKYYVKEKNVLLIYQLCRKIWFYEMWFPLNLIGYAFEFFYLRLLNDRTTITISKSSMCDLVRCGFHGAQIINVGIELAPLADLQSYKKFTSPTILSLGNLRSMKRAHHIVEAFRHAKESVLNLQLIIAGDANNFYGRGVLRQITRSPVRDSIRYIGRIDKDKKVELLQKCHLLVAAPVKEGWGLTVTEAASQGTPAVVYNVDGLRDSVKDGETGVVCQRNNPKEMAERIVWLLSNPIKYNAMRSAAWAWSKEINFDESYNQFVSILKTHVVK